MEYDTLGGVCANVEGHGPIADLTISDGHALMQAQGLGPHSTELRGNTMRFSQYS